MVAIAVAVRQLLLLLLLLPLLLLPGYAGLLEHTGCGGREAETTQQHVSQRLVVAVVRPAKLGCLPEGPARRCTALRAGSCGARCPSAREASLPAVEGNTTATPAVVPPGAPVQRCSLLHPCASGDNRAAGIVGRSQRTASQASRRARLPPVSPRRTAKGQIPPCIVTWRHPTVCQRRVR